MFKFINKLYYQNQASKMCVHMYSQQTVKQSKVGATAPLNPNVTGLSKKCVAVPEQPVGPNASKDKEYKNPEYFCYHVDSFAEAEVELAKFRLPAPSNRK